MADFPPNAGGSNNNNNNNNRRGSITQAALANLFRSPQFPTGNGSDSQRRRLSVTTVGLSAGPPVNSASFMRRSSVSTSSDSIDENAIEDEEGPLGGSRTTPNTPYTRPMSFSSSAPLRGFRTAGSPGNGNAPDLTRVALGPFSARNKAQRHPLQSYSVSLPANAVAIGAFSDKHLARADQYGFNWSEQLRSRAESSVAGGRPSFSFPLGSASSSPPRASIHDRSRSISEMPQPPVQAVPAKPKQERPKPDAFQERILKGDFYMD